MLIFFHIPWSILVSGPQFRHGYISMHILKYMNKYAYICIPTTEINDKRGHDFERD